MRSVYQAPLPGKDEELLNTANFWADLIYILDAKPLHISHVLLSSQRYCPSVTSSQHFIKCLQPQ